MLRAITNSESVQAPGQRRTARVLTIGHSTRPIGDFVALLKAHAVKRLVDVRTIPRSRHNPQFNRERIASELRRVGITYLHMKALGGLRHPRSDSVNTAWRNSGFRGFADHMQTSEFATALRRLMKMAKSRQTAIMCAEAVPWRCHRSLIADALLAHGYRVEEIASLKRTRPHTLTLWARVQGSKITDPESSKDPRDQADDRSARSITRSVGFRGSVPRRARNRRRET